MFSVTYANTNKPTFNLFGQEMKITVTTNQKEFEEAIERHKDEPYIKKKIEENKKFLGFSEFNGITKECIIYWPHPGNSDYLKYIHTYEDLRVLGHELLHCLVGHYHN